MAENVRVQKTLKEEAQELKNAIEEVKKFNTSYIQNIISELENKENFNSKFINQMISLMKNIEPAQVDIFEKKAEDFANNLESYVNDWITADENGKAAVERGES